MKINETKKMIVLTAAEMKEARKFGTPEYRALQEARRDYPGFATVQEKRKKNNGDFAKLTKADIIRYVDRHGSEEQKNTLVFLTKKTVDPETGEYHEPQPFFEVKKWFLNEFPDLRKARADYRQKVQSIYDAAEAKAAQIENSKIQNIHNAERVGA